MQAMIVKLLSLRTDGRPNERFVAPGEDLRIILPVLEPRTAEIVEEMPDAARATPEVGRFDGRLPEDRVWEDVLPGDVREDACERDLSELSPLWRPQIFLLRLERLLCLSEAVSGSSY